MVHGEDDLNSCGIEPLFFGFFTPTEARAVGALLSILIACFRRQLSWPGFIHALEDTTRISCMALVILTGAVIFGHFLAITRIPFELAHWVSSLPLPDFAIMTTILLMLFPGIALFLPGLME